MHSNIKKTSEFTRTYISLENLGKYILSNNKEWKNEKLKASIQNPWFIPEFIDLACNTIAKII